MCGRVLVLGGGGRGGGRFTLRLALGILGLLHRELVSCVCVRLCLHACVRLRVCRRGVVWVPCKMGGVRVCARGVLWVLHDAI